MKIKLLFIIVLTFGFSFAQTSTLYLNQNWKFKQKDSTTWYQAKIPGCVHTDLFANELIPHPFVGSNELGLQWVSEKSWVYRTEFKLTKDQLKNQNVAICFDGLDTYAKVILNGVEILNADNSFRKWKIDVKKLLKTNNTIQIEFTPTKIIEEKKKAEIPYELPEGNRVFTRKAQFQYGWDWGPKFNTLGVWRPVYLTFWNDLKLDDMYVHQLSLEKNLAQVQFEVELSSKVKKQILIDVFVNKLKNQTIQFEVKNGLNKIKLPIVSIANPNLWWTHNLGEQNLYEFKIQIKGLKGNLLDEKFINKGLRTIELVTDEDEKGESFYFKLNGVPVYMKGANYIPQNSFQSWVVEKDYEHLLQDVVGANMNMLRVWGGGIYEDDEFYDLCDKKGILIWQDFMFACAMYPGDEKFLENVRQEAKDNVKRLRNHSSIALWCGNNESSEGWHRWGWQDGRSKMEKAEIWQNYQELFSHILPEIVDEFTDIPYWETSPKFGRGDERYSMEGDAHDWWIWHDGHPFENLESKTPRFMSEFGFQSFPSSEVIRFINGGNSTSISSPNFHFHQKNSRGFEIIRTYMERDFLVPNRGEDYVYVSQLLQAYGIGKGIEAQRRNKPHTMGSLYWQLNDCWPAVSWSSIDFFGNKKALYYMSKHSFSDVLLSFEKENEKLCIFIVNDLLNELSGELRIEIIDFSGNKINDFREKVSVVSNESKAVYRLELDPYKKVENQIFIRATFKESSAIYYLVKPKELQLLNKPIETAIVNQDGFTKVRVWSETLHKNVELSAEIPGNFSNNFFDLLPGEFIEVEFYPRDKKELKKIEKKSLNILKTR